MKIIRTVLLSFAAVLLLAGSMYSKPMQARQNVDVPDGEKLTYGIYTSGVKSGEFYMVNKTNASNQIISYLFMNYYSWKKKVPDHYTNYGWYGIGDLKRATMTRYFQDNSEYYVKKNQFKGQFFVDINFGSEVNILAKTWDGFQVIQSISRIKNVDTNYPVWWYEGFLFLGSRYLNWEEPGDAMIIVPVVKSPLKSTFRVLKKETIETTAGKFDTTKVAWQITDAFLGNLLKQFTDTMVFNMENGPKKRMVRGEIMGQIYVLEKVELLNN